MRVTLPAGTKAEDVKFGRQNFTITGELIEVNVCEATADCRERAAKIKNEDGTPKFDPKALNFFR